MLCRRTALRYIVYFSPKAQFNPQISTSLLQDVEQFLACDSAEAVPARCDSDAFEVDIDIVPMSEVLDDLLIARRISYPKIFQSLVRKDHTPPEGAVRCVALEDTHLVVRMRLLHQECEIKSSRASTHNGNTQRRPLRNRHLEPWEMAFRNPHSAIG